MVWAGREGAKGTGRRPCGLRSRSTTSLKSIQETAERQVFFVSLGGERALETSAVFCSTCLFANIQSKQAVSKKADGQVMLNSKQDQSSE